METARESWTDLELALVPPIAPEGDPVMETVLASWIAPEPVLVSPIVPEGVPVMEIVPASWIVPEPDLVSPIALEYVPVIVRDLVIARQPVPGLENGRSLVVVPAIGTAPADALAEGGLPAVATVIIIILECVPVRPGMFITIIIGISLIGAGEAGLPTGGGTGLIMA